LGLNTRFIELAGEINTAMPEYVVLKTISALNIHKKALSGSKILVIGIAYKKDIDDARESPGIRIMELLLERGANVSYYDLYIPEIKGLRQTDLAMKSVVLTDELLSRQDAVIISTAHSSVDYQKIYQHSSLIIDTRNALSDITSNNIINA